MKLKIIHGRTPTAIGVPRALLLHGGIHEHRHNLDARRPPSSAPLVDIICADRGGAPFFRPPPTPELWVRAP